MAELARPRGPMGGGGRAALSSQPLVPGEDVEGGRPLPGQGWQRSTRPEMSQQEMGALDHSWARLLR